ncbi:site-specific integrase [Gluconobacter thailandicus]|uniref:site-specific integrase n=1 Tax=Gluconobacter thailandicus TaxID=257438 RepID=UPI001CD57B6A|nr:site-specific integrase [Gluconobacter thailandicus]
MANLTNRGGLYYVRFSIPKERWADAGKVLGSNTGIRRDILKSLQTRTHKEALRLRDAAIEAIRRDLNRKLIGAGLAPLQGVDVPDWMNEDLMLSEALEARREIGFVSDSVDFYDNQTGASDSPRDRVIESMDSLLEDRAQELDQAGKDGDKYRIRFKEIALGNQTPFSLLLDRWMKDRESYASSSVISLDRATLNHFSRYLAHSQGLGEPDDLIGFLRTQIVEEVPEMVLGGFSEWLMDDKRLSAKTAGNRITPLKVMWDFAIQKHILKGPNPWVGATAGLKRKAGKQKPDVRPFTEDELLKLLQADPSKCKRWAWGPAISDMMRLALFTGARQNELATLTVGRILNREGAEGDLWGLKVTNQEAKTKNSVRRIPLHPLVQPIIARRLREAGEGNTDAPLFPDCVPGGPGMKRGYYFAKRFPDFRRWVLGRESNKIVDFHSFRRSFITFFEQANANGASACTEMVRDRLIGHESKSLAGNTYAAKDLGWDLYSRAILGMVEKGISETVRGAI